MKTPKTSTDKPETTNRVGLMRLLGDVWLLEEGAYYSNGGVVVVAAKTKSAMLRWIKAEYPKHKRKREGSESHEIYFENDAERTWLRCQRLDKCPLVA